MFTYSLQTISRIQNSTVPPPQQPPNPQQLPVHTIRPAPKRHRINCLGLWACALTTTINQSASFSTSLVSFEVQNGDCSFTKNRYFHQSEMQQSEENRNNGVTNGCSVDEGRHEHTHMPQKAHRHTVQTHTSSLNTHIVPHTVWLAFQ